MVGERMEHIYKVVETKERENHNLGFFISEGEFRSVRFEGSCPKQEKARLNINQNVIVR